jgi:hypothetical protein
MGALAICAITAPSSRTAQTPRRHGSTVTAQVRRAKKRREALELAGKLLAGAGLAAGEFLGADDVWVARV